MFEFRWIIQLISYGFGYYFNGTNSSVNPLFMIPLIWNLEGHWFAPSFIHSLIPSIHHSCSFLNVFTLHKMYCIACMYNLDVPIYLAKGSKV